MKRIPLQIILTAMMLFASCSPQAAAPTEVKLEIESATSPCPPIVFPTTPVPTYTPEVRPSTSTPPPISPTASPSSTASPAPTSSLQTPDQFILLYFDHINQQDYSFTWKLLTERYQNAYHSPAQGGFEGYAGFWKTVERVEILNIVIRSQDSSSARVEVSARYLYTSGVITTSTVTYDLTFTASRQTWLIDAAPSSRGIPNPDGSEVSFPAAPFSASNTVPVSWKTEHVSSQTSPDIFPSVYSLFVDPKTTTTLYVEINDGLFKSMDGGNHWKLLTIRKNEITAGIDLLAIDPVVTTTLYANVAFDRHAYLYQSRDGGETWNPLAMDLKGQIRFLVIDPKNSSTLYAGMWHGVFKSTNGGGHWDLITPEMTVTQIHFLAIDPEVPDNLYIGTRKGVFKSSDGGSNWKQLRISMQGGDEFQILHIAIDPQSPTTLYASGSMKNAYKTTDGGETWKAINLGSRDELIRSLTVDPASSTNLYAVTLGNDLFQSTDGGASWNMIKYFSGNLMLSRLVIDPAASSTMYAGTSWGVYRSIDSGQNWQKTNTGLTDDRRKTGAAQTPTSYLDAEQTLLSGSTRDWKPLALQGCYVYKLVLDPNNPTFLYAVTDRGVYKSRDRGKNWSSIQMNLDQNTSVTNLAIDPRNPNTFYASTTDGIYKSTDNGQSWKAVSAGLTDRLITVVAFDPKHPNVIYAASNQGIVYKSTEDGENWSVVFTDIFHTRIEALAIDPKKPETLYAGTAGNGIYKSEDGGRTWNAANTGLLSPDITNLSIDPVTPTTLYASGYGLYKSENGGDDWNYVDNGFTAYMAYAFAIDPSAHAVLYAGTEDGQVFTSLNGGLEWKQIVPTSDNLYIFSLIVDPKQTRTVYAGTGGGIFTFQAEK